MQQDHCQSCQNSKSLLQCEACRDAVCKNCAVFLEEDHLSFLSEVPKELSHSTYCPACHLRIVAPALEQYIGLLEKAKNVLVYGKAQSKETRLLKRKEKPLKVENCKDHDETVLRLAFLAAQAGYNGLIDVELKSQKVKNGSYQTTIWSGTGVPTQIDDRKIPKDRSFWQNPN